MNCTVTFGNCFPLMCQPCCLLSCCEGKPGELAKNQFIKPTVQFVLSHSFVFLPVLKESSDDIGDASGSSASSAGHRSLGLEAGAPSIALLLTRLETISGVGIAKSH